MSTPLKAAALVGLCLLLVGCAPATGVKSIIAVVAMLVSVVAAWVGLSWNKDEDRVVRKGRELERKVANHVRKYH